MLKSFNDLILSDNMDEVNVAPETMSSFFIAFYCEKGTLQFSIEGEMYHAKEGDLVACTPRNIIGLYMRSPDLQGKVICMGESLVAVISLGYGANQGTAHSQKKGIEHFCHFEIGAGEENFSWASGSY